jgi:hypothetical protein
MKARAEELSLNLAGAVKAFQEMIAYVSSRRASDQGPKEFCIGLEVIPEPVDQPGLGDLPQAAFKKLQKSLGRAVLHPASQCVIFGTAAAFQGREAMLLTYGDSDAEIDEILRGRGIEVPKPRLSFEPNRMAPVGFPQSSSPMDARPDGRMRWDGYGRIGSGCGARSYDFSGDARNVRILSVWREPQIC